MTRCPHCELEYSKFAPFNHTAWCPNATTADWPKEILKNKRNKNEYR